AAPRAEPAPLPPDPGGHEGAKVWATRFGGPDSETGRSLAIDGEGNLVATGYVRGHTRFAEGYEHRAEGTDAYVARFSPDGSLLWARSFGGAGEDVGESVAVDSEGNAVVVGSFSEVLSFGDAEAAS